jgi:hypothetical protein
MAITNYGELTAGRLRQLVHYDPETGVFTRAVRLSNRSKVGDVLKWVGTHGYSYCTVAGKRYAAHRLAWLYVYGEWPRNDIDHINRDRLDNRIANLRDVTRSANLFNTKKRVDNKSGHKGIWRDEQRNRWQAYIRINGKQHSLGRYTAIEDAIAARIAAEHRFGVAA